VSRRRAGESIYLVRENPADRDLYLWGGVALLVGLALWKGKAVVQVVSDVVGRGKRLTYTAVGADGLVPVPPTSLCEAAGVALGRPLSQDAHDLARMIRSEGAAAGDVRAHVAINDAAELGWSLHTLLTYSTSSAARGYFGEQFTPAARAPGGIKSVRRYSTANDPFEHDVQVAERVLFERAGGADPTNGAVKFLDRASLGVQEGARSYESIVASWGTEGLRPFTLPGYSDDLVVFRRVA
jgi:hypothetical protein